MTNAIILGDVHLGKGINIGRAGIGAALNSRIADQLNLLDWTLDRAVEHNASHIILTGDIFEDPKPLPVLITLFIAWLKKCQAYDLKVFLIRGNHDILRSGYVYTSPLDIISEIELENVSVFKDIDTMIIGTTALTLLPFCDRKSFSVASNAEALLLVRNSLVYELASIPATYHKVLIGHLAIEGSIPVGDEIDDITNELFCPLDMFVGYDHVWMGHVHKPQVMQKEKPFIAHVGSMDISNFGETDHKKHIVIFNCHDNNWQIEYLPTRPLQKLTILVPKDVEDTTAYVLQELEKTDVQKDAIVRLEVSLSTPELKSINKSILEKYLSTQGIFSINGISESKKISFLKKDANSNIDIKMDVPSAIKSFMKSHVDETRRVPLLELAMEIYLLFKSEGKE